MNKKLLILWTTKDVEVAMHMAIMYAKNSKIQGWWEEVDLVIWGPSAQVVSENSMIQEELKMMQHVGVNIKACRACADRYGVAEQLEELQIEVMYMGAPLTEELKAGTYVLTV